jgi:hypothetical protein
MGKNKKKRNKVYTGTDAAITRPVITRISAVNRTRLGQWWFDHKNAAKPVLISSGVAIAIIVIVVELVHLFSGG